MIYPLDVGLGTFTDVAFFDVNPLEAIATNTVSLGLATGIGWGLGKIFGKLIPSRFHPGGLPKNPDNFIGDGWIETTVPAAGAAGHRTFTNPKTGDIVRFDAGTPGAHGHRGRDHYHWVNPYSTNNKVDGYLDQSGMPVPDGHSKSHLYP